MNQQLMISYRRLALLLFVLITSKIAAAQQPKFDTTLKPMLISDQFIFTEGPAADKKGNVFFTDQPNNKIWKYSTDGKLTVFKENAGRSNGMYFDKKGNLITCADEENQLWCISPSGRVKVLVDDFQGHRLNGPNDCWISPTGGIYFTDPYYQRPYWQRKGPDSLLGGQKLYYLPKDAKAAVAVAGDFVTPNGVTGSTNGKFLYVSDIGAAKIYRYTINPDGMLGDRALFVSALSDGLTTDTAGNVYIAGKGVTIYSSEGNMVAQYDIPRKWTSNLCFGGPNRNILFITASEALYMLPLTVTGSN